MLRGVVRVGAGSMLRGVVRVGAGSIPPGMVRQERDLPHCDPSQRAERRAAGAPRREAWSLPYEARVLRVAVRARLATPRERSTSPAVIG